MSVRQAFVDIVLALALFLLAGVLVAGWAAALPLGWRLPVTVVVQGTLLLGVVGMILSWRRQSWTGIWLVAPAKRDVGRGLLAFGACLGLNVVFVYLLQGADPGLMESHTDRLGTIARRLSDELSLWGLVGMLAFVGVYEELFARGLLLSRCRALLGGFWTPVLASSLLFGLGHLYQGWIGVGQTTLVGIVLAVVTLRWRTIWPAIIAHAVLDITSVLVMGGFIERAG